MELDFPPLVFFETIIQYMQSMQT